MRKAWLFLVLLCFPLLLLAEAASPDTIPIFDWVKGLFEVKWSELGVWGIVSVVLMAIVNATKVPAFGGLFDKLGSLGKRLLILGLSALVVGTTVLAAGGTFTTAVAAVVGSAAGATFFHELLTPLWELVKKLLGKGAPQ